MKYMPQVTDVIHLVPVYVLTLVIVVVRMYVQELVLQPVEIPASADLRELMVIEVKVQYLRVLAAHIMGQM